MSFIRTHKRSVFIYFLILSGLVVFTKCVGDESKEDEKTSDSPAASYIDTVTFDAFAGINVCGDCHKDIVNSFEETSHYHSSQIATETSVIGSFEKGRNSFEYDEGKIVTLEKRNDGLYQVYYHNGKEIVKRRFDIITGSGAKGQTYLSWLDNHLIELPVSYFTQVHQWANSPGYPRSPIIFNRPVTTRCLECHSTYAGTVNYNPDVPPVFDSTKMILGITCEKCHGPAAKHVAWEQQHPKDSVGMYIVNPSRLSEKLSLDVCALCHSGGLQEKTAPFQFVAGDTLSNYFDVSDVARKTGVMDVHGNQLGILSASKCFRMSKTMTCVTCHSPHKNERGNTELFSQRCMSCHKEQHKTIEGVSNNLMVNNCIDCHMPLQESTSITFLLQNEEHPVNAKMRTHFIKVYPGETGKFIKNIVFLNKKKL